MSGEYETMGAEELRARLYDWQRVARDQTTEMLGAIAELCLALHTEWDEADSLAAGVKKLRAERDQMRRAVEDAVDVLGGEDKGYDDWAELLGRLRAALDGAPPASLGGRLLLERDRLRAIAVAAQMLLTELDDHPIDQLSEGIAEASDLLSTKLAAAVAPHELGTGGPT